jgi:hypothetical protein
MNIGFAAAARWLCAKNESRIEATHQGCFRLGWDAAKPINCD